VAQVTSFLIIAKEAIIKNINKYRINYSKYFYNKYLTKLKDSDKKASFIQLSVEGNQITAFRVDFNIYCNFVLQTIPF